MAHNIDLLIKEYQTPLYVFDIDALKDRVHYLQSFFSNRITLCYAMKANPFLVKELEDVIHKLEVCSPGEYYICRDQHVENDQLVISGVYKTPSVIEEMLQDGVTTFTIESLTHFELLDALTKKMNIKVKLLLRLTSGNQFGMAKEEVQSLIHNRYNYPLLDIKGIQYFSGTQKTSTKRLQKECNMVDEFLETLYQEENYEAEELEFGPGFPVSYFEEGKSFEEDEFLKEFASILDAMHYQGQVILELGRSIAACCGQYMTSVVDMKQNQNGYYAIVDGGMHHLAYYGQMMAMKHPYHEIYPTRVNEKPTMWNICGSLCTVNDLIVKQLPITNLKKGDVIIFKNTGAYSMCEGISLFLSRDLPKVLFYKNGAYELVREDVPTYPLNSKQMERGR